MEKEADRGTINWAIAIMFLVNSLNLLDRQIINILAESIKTDLQFSDTQLGLLIGTAFGILYAVLGIPMGILADRVNRVKLITGVLSIWSSFTILCGFATNFAHLFLARMGVGVGEAGSTPAATSLLADIVPAGRQATAMSIFFLGAPAGAFAGLLIGGYIDLHWGWRAAFMLAGLPGLILAVLIFTTLRDPRSRSPVERLTARPSTIATLIALFKGSRFSYILVGLVGSSFFIYASGAWLPSFFIRVHGMSASEIGAYLAVAVGLGGAGGGIVSGILCDIFRTRVDQVELKIGAGLLALSMAGLLSTVLAASQTAALISLGFFTIFAYAYLGPAVVLVQREAMPENRGLAVAVATTVSGIFNLILALPVIGVVSDVLTPAYGHEAIRFAVAICAASIGTIGLAGYARASFIPSAAFQRG